MLEISLELLLARITFVRRKVNSIFFYYNNERLLPLSLSITLPPTTSTRITCSMSFNLLIITGNGADNEHFRGTASHYQLMFIRVGRHRKEEMFWGR